MSVIQFPQSDKEPTLIALAPPAYVRRDQWMGLTEAIAWVGSRDKRYSDAAYYYLNERPERRRADTPPLWFLMKDDLAEHYGKSLGDAEAEVMNGGLDAIGRFEGGQFEPMAPLLWVNVSLALDDAIDSIRRASIRENFGKPLWSHIRFKRAKVLARWPDANTAAQPVEVEVPSEMLPIASRGEIQAWVRAAIADDRTQTEIAATFRDAFVGKRVKLSREDVREIYRQEYGAAKGEVRPGPRVSS